MSNIHFNEDFKREFTSLLAIPLEQFDIHQNLLSYVNWDSLAVVSMMALVEQYFSVKMSGHDIESVKNLQELLFKIQNKLDC